MKTTLSKRYAIKVGTTFLSHVQKRVVILDASVLADCKFEDVVVPTLWSNKREAQGAADYLRNQFKPEDGDLIVTEFNMLVSR